MQNFWNNITIGWADTFSYLQLSGAVYLIWRNWFFPLFSSGFGDFHTILNQLYLGFSFPPPKPKQVMLESFIYPNIFSYMTSILLPFNRLFRTSSTKIFQCLNLTLIKTPRLHKQLKKKKNNQRTKPRPTNLGSHWFLKVFLQACSLIHRHLLWVTQL